MTKIPFQQKKNTRTHIPNVHTCWTLFVWLTNNEREKYKYIFYMFGIYEMFKLFHHLIRLWLNWWIFDSLNFVFGFLFFFLPKSCPRPRWYSFILQHTYIFLSSVKLESFRIGKTILFSPHLISIMPILFVFSRFFFVYIHICIASLYCCCLLFLSIDWNTMFNSSSEIFMLLLFFFLWKSFRFKLAFVYCCYIILLGFWLLLVVIFFGSSAFACVCFFTVTFL